MELRRVVWRSGVLAIVSLMALQLPAFTGSRDVVVEIDPDPGACSVHGQFQAAVPAAVAWEVLADYDHIPAFVHSMIASHRESHTAATPFSTSSTKTGSPQRQPHTRQTFVAPMLPLPCWRMSTPLHFAASRPNGTEPSK